MTEDEMVGWHPRLNGHEFEQAPGVGDEQRGLVCCSAWGHKESDTAGQLNNNSNSRHVHTLIAPLPLYGYISDVFQSSLVIQRKYT